MTDALEFLAPYIAGALIVVPAPFVARRLRLPPVATAMVVGAAFGAAWCACACYLLDQEELVFRNGPWRYVGLPSGVVTSCVDAAVGHITFWSLVGMVVALWIGRRERWRPGSPKPEGDEA